MGTEKVTIEVSGPHGKWASYEKNGPIMNTEGIYITDEKQTACKMIKALAIDDYIKNEEPRVSFGMRMGEFFGGCCVCKADPKTDPTDHNLYILKK